VKFYQFFDKLDVRGLRVDFTIRQVSPVVNRAATLHLPT